jgi:gamma-glutamyltranspeptidase/glutathione hydrolase
LSFRERFDDQEMLRRSPASAVDWSASSTRGMVATAHYLGTAAGLYALERGGNAFDAAATAAFALGVCEPAGSGLGGMALLLAHHAATGRTFLIDGSCRAPTAASPAEVARSKRYRGHRAVAVPRSVAALSHALARYGRLGRREVLEPAIIVAEEGFPTTPLQHDLARRFRGSLRRRSAGALFLDDDHRPRPPGTVLRQPVLARTLRRLAANGFEDFYRGAIAREIVTDMERHEGFVGAGDLEHALEVTELEPIWGSYDGSQVATAGPPGGGLALLHMLHMASSLPREDLDLEHPAGVVRVAAIVARARAERIRRRLRTGADDPGEAADLLDPEIAARAARECLESLGRPQASNGVPESPGHGETTHVSVMDGEGNVVSLTLSIERTFGAAVTTPGLGFIHNGYLRAFKVHNRRHPHYLRPGAPARSNAAPTLLLRGGRPWVAVGSAGSERIGSGIFQVLVRLGRSQPFDAVHGPRLHATPQRHVLWEEERFPRGAREALVGSGFTVESLGPYSFRLGGLQLVTRDGVTFTGVAEPRRDGAAAGPGDTE